MPVLIVLFLSHDSESVIQLKVDKSQPIAMVQNRRVNITGL